MSLEQEIKIVHDFLFDHVEFEEKDEVYRMMVADMRDRYNFNERTLLTKVAEYRKMHEDYKSE